MPDGQLPTVEPATGPVAGQPAAGRLAIDAVGLVKHYGEVRALDGVDLQVPEGTVLALLGPNGAGKTTLVSLISGTLAPSAGEVVFAGQRVTALPRAITRP